MDICLQIIRMAYSTENCLKVVVVVVVVIDVLFVLLFGF